MVNRNGSADLYGLAAENYEMLVQTWRSSPGRRSSPRSSLHGAGGTEAVSGCRTDSPQHGHDEQGMHNVSSAQGREPSGSISAAAGL